MDGVAATAAATAASVAPSIGGSRQQQWRQTMAVAAADCLNNNGRGGSGSGDITGCIFKIYGEG
jgi:hypothetical protein